jgi:hypothetical protein
VTSGPGQTTKTNQTRSRRTSRTEAPRRHPGRVGRRARDVVRRPPAPG